MECTLCDLVAIVSIALFAHAAHALGRDQPKPYLPSNISSSSSSRDSKSSKRCTGSTGQGGNGNSRKDSLQAGSPLPSWVDGLKAAGFDVLEREGELFLQRETAPQQKQHQQRQQQQHLVSALRIKQARDQADISSSSVDGIDEARRGAIGAAIGSAGGDAGQPGELVSCRVGAEFQPGTWQLLLDSLAASPASSSAAAAGAAAASNVKVAAGGLAGGRGSSTDSGIQSEEEEEEKAAVSSWLASSGLLSTIDEEIDANSSSTSSSRKNKQKGGAKSISSRTKVKLSTVQRALWSFSSPEALLKQLEFTFPAWSDNGCRLVGMTAGTAHRSSSSSCGNGSSRGSGSSSSRDVILEEGRVVVAAPTPAEAAVALKGVAIAAKKAKLRSTRMMSLVSRTGDGTNA